MEDKEEEGFNRIKSHKMPPTPASTNSATNSAQGLQNAIPFKYLIPLLFVVLQVHSQGQPKSFLYTHPIQIWISVFASAVYYFMVKVDTTRFAIVQNNPQLPGCIAFISGSLASVSILSIFLGKMGFLVYITWIILAVMVILRQLIISATKWLWEGVMNGFSRVWNVFGNMLSTPMRSGAPTPSAPTETIPTSAATSAPTETFPEV